nr:MAG TPA: chromosome partitioning protein [Caudoviricetes sp.]
MAKFDLKGMLSERSTKEMDIPEQKTVYRNPEDLIPSEDNFYSTEDTEKLKQSIKCLGILQPLLIENRDGKDYIIAGHSRRKCCLELIEEGEERFRKVPCVYKPKIELPGEEDEIIRKILIIQSNTYREKSDWEKMMESLKMESLVKELREKTELEGKTREIVSDLIGVSSTQIGRYHSISSNLSERLMEAFRQSKLNISTAAELAGLNEKYQAEACKILEETGQVTLNAAKLLKAQQEQERELPGQMTIEEALHPTKPQEIDTVIPVDIQIDRFYESLRKNVETYIRQSDRNMTIYMLSALYGSVRVRNGHLNYQGRKEGILFNPGSNQEELVSWKDFSERLIAKYGKKKSVKTASVIEKETQNNISEPAKCITGQSGSGQCGAAAYCDKGYNCCAQCPDDCNGRCGWIESCQPAAEPQDEKQHDSSDHTDDPAEILPENWPEYLKDIPIPTETALASYLYDQERELKQILDIEKEEPGLPYMTIMQQQMVVAGLRLLQNCVKSMEEPE